MALLDAFNWVQAIGWAAAVVSLLSYQAPGRGMVIALQIVSCLLLVAHYVGLGTPVGAVFNFLALLRGLAALWNNRWRRHLVLGFLPLLWGVAIVSHQDWKDLIPAMAMTFSTFAQAAPRILNLRLYMLASSPLWFAYAALCGSQGGMAYEILNTLSNGTAIFRYHLLPWFARRRTAA
ncbi:MAG TPA: YgjV family protein [Candidatus Sulfotelmatobacter sp.]|jgi:hypothetical protein|nr:YgjV family protein [Candidatus Sulfotelmatobacter sp.]